MAALTHDDEQIRALLPQAEAALEIRAGLRQMIRDHEKDAHLKLSQSRTAGE